MNKLIELVTQWASNGNSETLRRISQEVLDTKNNHVAIEFIVAGVAREWYRDCSTQTESNVANAIWIEYAGYEVRM